MCQEKPFQFFFKLTLNNIQCECQKGQQRLGIVHVFLKVFAVDPVRFIWAPGPHEKVFCGMVLV